MFKTHFSEIEFEIKGVVYVVDVDVTFTISENFAFDHEIEIVRVVNEDGSPVKEPDELYDFVLDWARHEADLNLDY